MKSVHDRFLVIHKFYWSMVVLVREKQNLSVVYSNDLRRKNFNLRIQFWFVAEEMILLMIWPQKFILKSTILVSNFFSCKRMKITTNFFFQISARFGQISTMRRDIRCSGIGVQIFDPRLKSVKIVFTTLNNAVDLLQ